MQTIIADMTNQIDEKEMARQRIEKLENEIQELWCHTNENW